MQTILAAYLMLCFKVFLGERGGSVVECPTPEREVGGSIPLVKTLYSPKVLVNYPGSVGSVPT